MLLNARTRLDSVVGVYLCSGIILVFISEWMVAFRVVVHSPLGFVLGSTFGSDFDYESDFDSEAYFAIAPPETPISLRSSL